MFSPVSIILINVTQVTQMLSIKRSGCRNQTITKCIFNAGIWTAARYRIPYLHGPVNLFCHLMDHRSLFILRTAGKNAVIRLNTEIWVISS